MNKLFSLIIFSTLSLLTVKAGAQNSSMAAAPVLIELFTSQGCSSCPPAERLLNSWGMELFQAKKALPLAFHVDYWDYLGWQDPFSSPAASSRQRNYGAFFQDNSIYTPQMIVQGQVGINGSDRERTQREFSQAQISSIAPLEILATVRKRIIQAHISTLPVNLSKSLVLYAVVFENGLETSVERGENSGAVLKENFVVRSLTSIPLDEFKNNLTLPNPGIIPAHAGLAVWLQDPQTMKVQGLQWVYPLSKN